VPFALYLAWVLAMSILLLAGRLTAWPTSLDWPDTSHASFSSLYAVPSNGRPP